MTQPTFAPRAAMILGELAQAILRHEYVTGLHKVLADAQVAAQALLIDAAIEAQKPGTPQPAPAPAPGETLVYRAEKAGLKSAAALSLLDDLRSHIAKHPTALVDIVVSVRETK
ncbi:MAG: hypothetical protein A3H27_03100 [Acidobacteria bacterium RIFCSPLOWO2_02_FULL_59_13]|nr:MAG: hypothetical protein A3H27_03100 [Acidobacteria bacterium RIFCSPLOWO2_02_FULL_59_13]